MTTPAASRLYSRRRFLVAGGTSALGAATLAACAKSPVVNSSGTVPTTLVPATAPPTTASAATIEEGRAVLRTATSLEHSLANFYDTFGDAAYLDEDAKTWGALFRDHHAANATALEALTETAGGKRYTGPNEYLDTELIAPGLKLADAQKSPKKLIELAAQLEATGAATGTLAVESLALGELRQGLMAVAATNSRQASVWQLMTDPGNLAGALPDAQYSVRDALPGAAAVDKADDEGGD